MINRLWISPLALSCALLLGTSQAQAFDLSGAKDAVKGAVGSAAGSNASGSGLPGIAGLAGINMPSLDSVGTGNVTGVLKYCMKNKYLGSDSPAAKVSDKLTGLLGGEEKASQDKGYAEGLKGILGGNSDSKLDLSSSSLKDKVTNKVCDKVMEYGSSLL